MISAPATNVWRYPVAPSTTDKVTVPAEGAKSFDFDASWDEGPSPDFSLTDTAITVVKDTDPDDGQDFEFTETITPTQEDSTTFTLDDGGDDDEVDNTLTFPGVLADNTYSVTETQVDGWELTNIVCTSTGGSTFTYTGGNPDPAFQPGDDTANVALAPEDVDVSCTFTNTDRRGTIIIVHDADPDSAQDFTFTQNTDKEGPFTLDDDADETASNTMKFENVVAGTYSVNQALVPDWALAGLNCDDDNSTGNTGTRTASIVLDPNETVTCTFSNVTTQAQR